MASTKPRIVFDTQLVIDRRKGRIADDEWNHARKFIREKCQYLVSPLTFLELLNGIANATEAGFQNFRRELNALIPSHMQVNFLKSPGSFVLKTVFGISRPHQGYEHQDLKQWLRLIFRAKSYHELVAGEITVQGLKGRTIGLNPTVVLEQTLGGKRVLVDQLNKVRTGELQISNRLTWARLILTRLGQMPNHEDSLKLANALDGAYEFFAWLCQQAKTSNYKFEKHTSDWFDSEQLYYLADPHMYLVTSDGDFTQRVRKSSQAARLVTYRTGGVSTLADVLKRALG